MSERLRRKVRPPQAGDEGPAHPTDPGDAWGWAPALRSAGAWLVCDRADGVVAYAPPGVAIDDTRDDDVEVWRRGSWISPAEFWRGVRADAVERLAVADVVEAIPADYAHWVHVASLEQIHTLSWFAATAPDPERPDRHARAALAARNRLVAELRACELRAHAPLTQ